MAFPFQDAGHGVEACVVRYERTAACFEPWRGEERRVAVMLLVVPVAVFAWMVRLRLLTYLLTHWVMILILGVGRDCTGALLAVVLAAFAYQPSEREHAGGESDAPRRPLPAIGYRDVEDQGEEDSLAREVTNLNKDSQLATHVEGSRTKSSGLLNEAAIWRRQEGRAEER